LGDFLGNFLLSLGDFLTKTSGHPDRKPPCVNIKFLRNPSLFIEK
jgi:hypothetical protein